MNDRVPEAESGKSRRYMADNLCFVRVVGPDYEMPLLFVRELAAIWANLDLSFFCTL